MMTERYEIFTPDHDIQATTDLFRLRALTYRLKRLELQHNPKGFMKQIATFVLCLVFAIPSFAQEYAGAGVGAGYSTADRQPKPLEFFGVVQQQIWRERIRLRGLGGLRTQPLLQTLFQPEALRQDGYEIFGRAEADATLAYLGPALGFVGIGADGFRQSFPKEPGGSRAHYHDGLNPTASAGVHFDVAGMQWRVAATRVFQEFKLRKFPYVTAYRPGGRLKSLQSKGTFNPSGLHGWRLNVETLRPITEKWTLRFEFDGGYYYFRQFPDKSFGDSYTQYDGAIVFRASVLRSR